MEKLNDPKTRGSILRRLIKSNHMTQEKFAEAIGYEPRTIRRWIQKGISDVDKINEIAKFFEVNVKDILFS